MLENPLLLVGAHGSPYSRKMRALLRYRRIPFRWIVRGSAEDVDIPDVPVALIPVVVFPDRSGAPGTAMIDSTPVIRELEALHPDRPAVPPDPALAFVDELLEDFADEWLTKAMYHYRWAHAPDAQNAARLLPLDRAVDMPADVLEKISEQFAARQIGRLAVVGSNETTAPVIEEGYRRVLALLDALLAERPFLLGARPGAADFAFFGQLSQLVGFDPTPAAIAAREAPRVVAWVNRVEDLSGLAAAEGGWLAPEALGAPVQGLLQEMGRTYVPFLLANAQALAAGAGEVRCQVDGRRWVQAPFRYQGRCLEWLRRDYAALTPDDRARVDAVLAGTGVERLFA